LNPRAKRPRVPRGLKVKNNPGSPGPKKGPKSGEEHRGERKRFHKAKGSGEKRERKTQAGILRPENPRVN